MNGRYECDKYEVISHLINRNHFEYFPYTLWVAWMVFTPRWPTSEIERTSSEVPFSASLVESSLL